MFCSRQRQIKLLSINTDVLSNFLLVDSSFISLWIQGNPSWIRGLLPGTNSLVSVPSKKALCVFSSGFRDISWYQNLNLPWSDGDHHNIDGGDDVNNLVLTRSEFLDFCDENQCDSTKQNLD